MNKTPNYQLNQWSKDDRVLMEDFNADNAKADAAIKAQADGIAALRASVSALQTAVGKKQDAASAVKFAWGTYTGDGEESRVVPLSFTPKAVLVFAQTGYTYSSSHSAGGLATAGQPTTDPNGTGVVWTTSGGFGVRYLVVPSKWTINSNQKGLLYHYIALA